MATRKIWIYPGGNPGDRDQAEATIAAVSCVEIVDGVDDADIVVVLVGSDARADEQMRERLAGSADGRFRVIGVYVTPGDDELPAAVADMQTGLVPLDPMLLERVICGGEKIALDGTGGAYVAPETERRCRKRRC